MASDFIQRARSETAKKNILITILPNSQAARHLINAGRNLWESPMAIRLATDFVDVDGYSFSPGIVSFPEILHEIDPLRRAISQATLSFEILGDMPFPIDLNEETNRVNLPIQADLHVEGASETKRIFFGIGNFKKDTYLGSYTCQADETVLGLEKNFPLSGDTLNRDAFPRMKHSISGRYPRGIILNDFDYQILCPMVDDGTLFYLCDHKLTVPPNKVFVDGSEIDSGKWRLEEINSDFTVDPRLSSSSITMIRLLDRFTLTNQYLTCSGGVGIRTDQNPPIFLIEKYGQMRISDRARAVFKKPDFDLSIRVESPTSINSLMNDRILPQTNYFGGAIAGKFEVFGIEGRRNSRNLSIGDGLIGRTTSGIEVTDPSIVYNAIEITYRRNPYSTFVSDSGSNKYYLTKDNATGPLRDRLSRSVRDFGFKMLRLDMPDIINQSNIPGAPPTQVTLLAEKTLNLLSNRHKIYEYYVPWEVGLSVQLNDIIHLNDTLENLTNYSARIISKKFLPNCVQVKFLEEFE